MSKKKIIGIILAALAVILALPFLLEFFVFRNDVYSALSNGEWGSFLGSYIGGALGGIGTLLAVYITTKETRKIQQENARQIEIEKRRNERRERKQFVDEVAKDVASYVADISKYFYACRYLNRLYDKKGTIDNELDQTQHEIRKKYNNLNQQRAIGNMIGRDEDVYILGEIEELKQKESEQKYRIEKLEREIDKNKPDRKIAIERRYLLNIKLKNIEAGEDILIQLEKIHGKSYEINRNDSNSPEEDDERVSRLTNELYKLLDMTVQFANEYVGQETL